jgi:hypothetical protein
VLIAPAINRAYNSIEEYFQVRFIPVHAAAAQRLIEEYLAIAGHVADSAGPLSRPVTNNRTGELDRPLDPGFVYTNIVQKYGLETGLCTDAG